MAVSRAFSTAPELSEMLTVTKSCAKVLYCEKSDKPNYSLNLSLD